jgi:hypothetical protein
MAAAPAFAAVPKIGATTVATANTGRDGTGTIATVVTAASGGTQIREVDFKGLGTTAAANIVLYLHDGSTYTVLTEIPVTAITASTTTASYSSAIRFDNLYLPSGWSLRASVTVVQSPAIAVIALGADL